jgi:hypothetical protein
MTIRVMPRKEFAALLLVNGLREGACQATSYCKRPSVAAEGGSHFTRFHRERRDDIS